MVKDVSFSRGRTRRTVWTWKGARERRRRSDRVKDVLGRMKDVMVFEREGKDRDREAGEVGHGRKRKKLLTEMKRRSMKGVLGGLRVEVRG